MDVQVIDHPAQQRFEAVVDGHMGRLDYARRGGTIVMEHVVVPEAVQGRGVAAALTQAAFDAARSEGLRVVPRCPYVVAWLRKHPQYADLVDAG